MSIDTDLVRTLVGDDDADNQLMTDDQVNRIVANYSSNYLAAAGLADAIAAKFSRKVTFSLEGLSIQNVQKADNYRKLAQRLRSQALLDDPGGLGMIVTGTSKSGMDAVEDNSDRTQTKFKVDMQKAPIPSEDDDGTS